jgi:hypothetical protein
MKGVDIVPALLQLGRLEGSAHGFREAAKGLRALAQQLDQAATTAETEAIASKRATDVLVTSAAGPYQRGEALAHRLLGAIRAAQKAWSGAVGRPAQ